MMYWINILSVILMLHLALGHGRNEVIDIAAAEGGLKAGDIIEWKGRVSSRRAPSSLYISAGSFYTLMKMQIQGQRNRMVFLAGRKGQETVQRSTNRNRSSYCTLGKNIIAPKADFHIFLRIEASRIMVYWNKQLKFTLPLSRRSQELLGQVSSLRLYGYHETQTFRKLSYEDIVGMIGPTTCGRTSGGGEVPSFCPKPNGTVGCRVVGGEPAIPGNQPWQAAIRKKSQFVNYGAQSHICGATLIGSRWAVAAGHCFLSTTRSALNRIVLRVGDYYNEDGSPYSQHIDVERSHDMEIEHVFLHHGFHRSSGSPSNDIALIKLRRDVQYTGFVKPACLPTAIDQFSRGSKCGISGWGASNLTQHISEYPKCLQTAGVTLIDNATCTNAHHEEGYDSEVMFCAGNPCVDACLGDSGGPLMCAQPGGQKFTLWGITSWGIGCGNPDKPGVYTRLAKYIPWLFVNMYLTPDETIRNQFRSGAISDIYCQHRA